MPVDPWHLNLILLARQGGQARPPAMRSLFYQGWMVADIASAVGCGVGEVQAALKHQRWDG